MPAFAGMTGDAGMMGEGGRVAWVNIAYWPLESVVPLASAAILDFSAAMSWVASPEVTRLLKSEAWMATWLIVPLSRTSVICQPFWSSPTT